jgi:hypothetical protein
MKQLAFSNPYPYLVWETYAVQVLFAVLIKNSIYTSVAFVLPPEKAAPI